MPTANKENPPLPGCSPSQVLILLALLEGDQHGYVIMQSVERLSAGATKMGPGTLYGAIKRLLEMGLIAEAGERPDAELDDERRRYYTLTGVGKKVLRQEHQRMQRLVNFADAHLLLS